MIIIIVIIFPVSVILIMVIIFRVSVVIIIVIIFHYIHYEVNFVLVINTVVIIFHAMKSFCVSDYYNSNTFSCIYSRYHEVILMLINIIIVIIFLVYTIDNTKSFYVNDYYNTCSNNFSCIYSRYHEVILCRWLLQQQSFFLCVLREYNGEREKCFI